jgi:hypothetical protein
MEAMPSGLVAIAEALEDLGYVKDGDLSPRPGFRVITYEHYGRALGRVVELVQEHGIWGVEISVEGDHSQGPDAILTALDPGHVAVRAGFAGMRNTTFRALQQMPQTEPEATSLREGLHQQRRELTRWATGRDRNLALARRLFRDERFADSLAIYDKLDHDELSRADHMRIEIARDRTTPL